MGFNFPIASAMCAQPIAGGLSIPGDVTMQGNVSMSAGKQLLIDSGTVGAPGLAFVGDTNLGVYRGAADQMWLSGGAGGGLFAVLGGSSAIAVPDGTVGTPGVCFINDTDTGIYRNAANKLGMVAGGVNTGLFTNAQFLAPDGSTAAPGISYIADVDTGFVRTGANQISGSVGNSLQCTIDGGASYLSANRLVSAGQIEIGTYLYIVESAAPGAVANYSILYSVDAATKTALKTSQGAAGTIVQLAIEV